MKKRIETEVIDLTIAAVERGQFVVLRYPVVASLTITAEDGKQTTLNAAQLLQLVRHMSEADGR